MNFSIIPDYTDMNNTFSLVKSFGANLEYDDFFNPAIYEDATEINRRISRYMDMERDMSKDTLHGAFLGLDISSEDSVICGRSRELYEQSLKIAYRMGVKGVVFHTGLIGGLRLEGYLQKWLDDSVYFWTEMCKKYSELMIYMENSFEKEPDMFVRLMERMQEVPNFKICLDYGHAILTPTPIEEWCKSLAPYIGHMHLNDNDLVDDLHLVPGNGKIDFQRWNELMKEYKIDCSVLLEVSGNDKAKAALEYMTALVRKKDE